MKHLSEKAKEEAGIARGLREVGQRLQRAKTDKELTAALKEQKALHARRIELASAMDEFECVACGKSFLADQPGTIYGLASKTVKGEGGRPQPTLEYSSANRPHFYLCAGCGPAFEAHNAKR